MVVGALALVLGASGCTRIRTHQGYQVDKLLVESVQPGIDNRASVEATLGRPTFTAQFGQADWYYVSREMRQLAFASPRPVEQTVLRVRFDDPQANWVYLDPYTGTVALAVDRRQRAGRWLFSFLHSWDLPPLLRAGPWREGVLILLSLGGLALSATGMVIGWRRLRTWWRARLKPV